MQSPMKLEDEMVLVQAHADGRLLAGRIGRVGVLLINQPEKRNAMNLAMWQGLCAALDSFAADDSVRVVIYAGAGGRAFNAGNDISEFAEKRDSAAANEEFTRITGRGRDSLAAFPKPSIACIQGYCLGGGLALALQADLRVAGSDAVFGIPAARMGIAYPIEPLERLVALVGPARARLMLYSARHFSAAEAAAFGLVEVLAGGDPVREAVALAASIAGNAPLSVQAAKATVEQILREPALRDLPALAEQTRRCMDSADYREGRTAFTEKRQPVFVGA